jgi:NAD(P)-dependent dehydrogenase (short-subunit alcohol dehydrogenase family)
MRRVASKTWFITGASRPRGFGRTWTIAALDRGDRVAAAARDVRTLDDLAEKYGDAIFPLEQPASQLSSARTATSGASMWS